MSIREFLPGAISTQNRPYLWLAILPSIVFGVIGLHALIYGLDSYLISADPSYNYLVNSYEVMTGAAPFAIHHPGTPLQYLMGVANWLAWLLSGRQEGTFASAVVAQPEWFLQVDLMILVLVQAGALAFTSIIILRRWGLAASLVFSGAALILISTELNIFLVGPVALSFAFALLTVGLAIKIICDGASTRTSLIFGAILACGVMNKATFLPMLGLAGIYLFTKGFRAALIGFGVTGIVFALLIRDQIPHMGYWFIGLLSTTGRNPSDVANLTLVEKLMNTPSLVLGSMPWIQIFIAISIVMMIVYAIHCKKVAKQIFQNTAFNISLLGLVVMAGSTVMTVKDYRQGDLIILAGVIPMLAASAWYLLGSISPKQIVSRFMLWLAAAIALFASVSFSVGQVAITQAKISADYLAEIEYLESLRLDGNYVAFAYGVFTQGTALSFGDDLSNHLLTGEIDRRYPRQLSLNLQTLQIQSRSDAGFVTESCEELLERDLAGLNVIAAPGRLVDPQALAQANGASTVELLDVFGQLPVYRLSGFECSTD